VGQTSTAARGITRQAQRDGLEALRTLYDGEEVACTLPKVIDQVRRVHSKFLLTEAELAAMARDDGRKRCTDPKKFRHVRQELDREPGDVAASKHPQRPKLRVRHSPPCAHGGHGAGIPDAPEADTIPSNSAAEVSGSQTFVSIKHPRLANAYAVAVQEVL